MTKKLSRRTALKTIVPAAALTAVALPGAARAADQPHMQAALDALQTAKRELASATPDKGGHRAKAISLVNQAITHVQQGIQFDRRH